MPVDRVIATAQAKLPAESETDNPLELPDVRATLHNFMTARTTIACYPLPQTVGRRAVGEGSVVRTSDVCRDAASAGNGGQPAKTKRSSSVAGSARRTDIRRA